jgi:pimeloyl-ACP methyl ester carboxylesterase
MICAAHPVDDFDDATAHLLSQTARASVTCVNPRRGPLERMVEDLEEARRGHGIDRWMFWGMSGGGWLAQLYARMYPASLTGIVIESACASFRARLADPGCVLSPAHPLWRAGLEAAGLFALESSPSSLSRTAWVEFPGGELLRVVDGPALMVAPGGLGAPMKEALPHFWSFDARPWLASLSLPTLVLAGTSDPIVPVSQVRAVADAIPGARYLEVPGAGHVPTTERHPTAASAVRDFLSKL